MPPKPVIHIGANPLSIADICAIARQQAGVKLDATAAFVERIDRGASFIDTLLQQQGYVYGVTTGFGDSCTTAVALSDVEQLPKNLYTFHGCGLGAYFSAPETRAILATRINSLARGYSGVRYLLLQHIALLLEQDILPIIPEEGSVGASGDLTPLSYLAAVLAGERNVLVRGKPEQTATVLQALSLDALTLRPKEGLAIMNGTAVMTALACLAFERAEYLAKLCTRITSLASVALCGNAAHFDEQLFALKPHAGQMQIAAWLRDDLAWPDASPSNDARLQDRYSLRCAPHVIGVLQDSLPWFKQFIENELNSVNDNPVIDAENRQVLHGGHFYGGHIAMAMDAMKTAVANLADLMDRQLAQLVDPKFNHGLAPNLSGAPPQLAATNHGLKAVQIAVSAWTAEALKLTMPASVFSRSTECHNQDKVSMGTIAARDCRRVLELTEQVAAALLIAVVQAVELRGKQGLSPPLQRTIAEVRAHSSFLSSDRALENELRTLVDLIRDKHWCVYD